MTLSGATRGDVGERVIPSASGATRLLREPRDVLGRIQMTGWRPRSGFKTALIATILPFAHVDEMLFRRRWEADTVSGYVVYVGAELAELVEIPSIIAVWPQRETFRFRSRRPKRRLAPREPFVSSADLLDDE